MAEVFTEYGYTTTRHTHEAVNTGLTQHLSRELKEMKYAVVWIEFPIEGHHVRPKKYFAHMAQLCNWASLCAGIGTQLIIFGSTGKKWSDPQLQILLCDGKLHIAKHRACHFGIKLDAMQSEPSGSCFATASTQKIPSHQCKCDVPYEQHRIDWHTPPTSSQSNLKLTASAAIGKAILPECVPRGGLGQRNAPDSIETNDSIADSYLTEGHQRKIKDRCKRIKKSELIVPVGNDEATG